MIKLVDIPWWYYLLAALLSLYYAYRGYMGNKFVIDEKSSSNEPGHGPKRWQYKLVYSVNDVIFHFICSIAGFYSMAEVYYIFKNHDLTAGNSIILIFLILFGIIGITGQWPQLILRGKLPWIK